MKRIQLLLLLLLAKTIVMAQEAAVQLDKENIMYVGVPNPITVVARNTPCSNLTIAIDSGEVRSGFDTCRYEVSVKKSGISLLRVYKNTKKGKTLIATREIRVKRIPDPVAKLGGIRSGSMKRSILAAQLGIVASIDNFDICAHIAVKHFTIMIIRNKQTIFSKTINAARFDDEVTQQLLKLKGDDAVFVCDIIGMGPDGISKNLDPIYIKVIE